MWLTKAIKALDLSAWKGCERLATEEARRLGKTWETPRFVSSHLNAKQTLRVRPGSRSSTFCQVVWQSQGSLSRHRCGESAVGWMDMPRRGQPPTWPSIPRRPIRGILWSSRAEFPLGALRRRAVGFEARSGGQNHQDGCSLSA